MPPPLAWAVLSPNDRAVLSLTVTLVNAASLTFDVELKMPPPSAIAVGSAGTGRAVDEVPADRAVGQREAGRVAAEEVDPAACCDTPELVCGGRALATAGVGRVPADRRVGHGQVTAALAGDAPTAGETAELPGPAERLHHVSGDAAVLDGQRPRAGDPSPDGDPAELARVAVRLGRVVRDHRAAHGDGRAALHVDPAAVALHDPVPDRDAGDRRDGGRSTTSNTRSAVDCLMIVLPPPAPLIVRLLATLNAPLVRVYVPAGTTIVSPGPASSIACRSEPAPASF